MAKSYCSSPPNASGGWFKATRSLDALELIAHNSDAFILAYVIAFRACYRTGFNRHNLQLGQAFIGDFRAYGMTERRYRTAKQTLATHRFATFKPTTKGTIATLTDTRLFEVLPLADDEQTDGRATDKRRTSDGQATTNIEHIEHRPLERREDVRQLDAPKPDAAGVRLKPHQRQLSDAEWLAGLKSDPAFQGLDVQHEYARMLVWCKVNHRQPTRRRFVNWLNRSDRPMSTHSVAEPNQIQEKIPLKFL